MKTHLSPKEQAEQNITEMDLPAVSKHIRCYEWGINLTLNFGRVEKITLFYNIVYTINLVLNADTNMPFN